MGVRVPLSFQQTKQRISFVILELGYGFVWFFDGFR